MAIRCVPNDGGLRVQRFAAKAAPTRGGLHQLIISCGCGFIRESLTHK